MPKLLFIEDDVELLTNISLYFNYEGFQVFQSETGTDGIALYRESKPDIVVLDWKLGDLPGGEVLLKLRDINPDIPIIVYTGIAIPKEKNEILQYEPDEIIEKPNEVNYLKERILYHLKKNKKENDNRVLKSSDFSIDYDAKTVKIKKIEIVFAKLEYKILELLTKNPNKVLEYELIFEKIWGFKFSNCKDRLKVRIQKIRQKIEKDPENPKYIKTIQGVGYLFIQNEKK